MWPGIANIAGGVTLDLSDLSTVQVSKDKSTVSVAPGARWGDVFAVLDAHSLAALGGRVSTVGVGGLTLGGGISAFSPRYGFTCDTVKNFEVVLASGAIVQANAKQNRDLFYALRGASNNFGVVTRIDLEAFPQGPFWGGGTNHDIATTPQQLKAAADLASASPYDEFASLVQTYTYIAGLGSFVSNTMHYTKTASDQEVPAFFKPFTDIPNTGSTLRVGNLSSFGAEGAAGSPHGYRASLAEITVGDSLEVLTAAVDAWNKSIASLQSVSGLMYQLLLEPIPEGAYKRAAPGTNSLGLEGARGGLTVVGVAVGWTDAVDDALVEQTSKQVVADIEHEAKRLGQYNKFVYLNYASPWQKVIESYGAESVAKLKKVSKRYDPKGVFQKRVPGGFKLP